MTQLSSKSALCLKAATNLGPEDTARFVELFDTYSAAGLGQAPAAQRAASDLVAEIRSEGEALLKSVAALAAVASSRIPRIPFGAYGAEDQTNATTRDSNILVNPYFTGTAGTVGANITGTVPTSWTVDWATRTGTGSAAASIVDVTDPDSGLATAKAIQLVLSGSPAANDVLRITQASGFNSLINGGDVVQAECMLRLTSPTLIDGVPMRLQTNTSESTWWGLSNQTKAAFSEGFEVAARTREMTVLGTGAASAARFDVRVNFSGAGTGTILFWLPRVRKVI